MLKKTSMIWTIISIASFATICNAEEDQAEVQFVAHYIRIHESGSFFGKTWHEMDTSEAKAGVEAICAYFGCTIAVPIIVAGIHESQQSVGKNYKTTGVIHKHEGESWYIAFPAPVGYSTCSAAYDSKTISANKGDTTTGTIFRNPASGENWVGTYNVVPVHRPEGHWVSVDFVVKYVKAGTETKHQCAPNKTPVWNVSLAQ